MIRLFSLSDLNAILNIERQSFPKSPYDRMTFLHLYSLYSQHFFVSTGMTPGGQEEVWGYIVFAPDGHIISLAVLPKQRRKGIGSELLQKAMQLPHLKRLRAEVRRSNLGAQAFYLRMGFRIIGVLPDYYGNEDAFLIQWTPPPLTPASS